MAVKLYYFHLTGLGEPVRLMLSAAKIEFEDIRLTKEEWAEMKHSLKWPYLPLLEIDGKSLRQSRAICRYIARKAGLVGSNEDDAVFADITVDTLDDMRQSITKFYYQPDSPTREEGLKNRTKNEIPICLENLEQQLSENNGYLVGGKLTWADIMLLSYVDYIASLLNSDILSDFPQLKEHVEKIKQLPGIKEYWASRPEQVKDPRQLFS